MPPRTITYVCPVCAASLLPEDESSPSAYRAWQLADAYARSLLETEGIKQDAWTYLLSYEQQADDSLIDDAISHLRERGRISVSETHEGSVVVMLDEL